MKAYPAETTEAFLDSHVSAFAFFGGSAVDPVRQLDRLTHHVHILEMNGDSYRLKQSKSRRRRSQRSPNADASQAESIDPSTGEIIS